MKKFSALFLALCLILSLAACKNKNVNSNVSSNFTKNESTTASKETENTESKTEESLGSGDSSQTASVASKPISASKPAETSKPTQSGKPTVTSKPSSAPSTGAENPTEKPYFVKFEYVSRTYAYPYYIDGVNLVNRLYGDKYMQTNDTVTYRIVMSDGGTSGFKFIDKIGNISVNGNLVTISTDGTDIGGGHITEIGFAIETKDKNGNAIAKSLFYNVIKEDFCIVENQVGMYVHLRDYAMSKGLKYYNGNELTGYTANDESLSITNYNKKGTDDYIPIKAEVVNRKYVFGNKDWIKEVLWVIDKYAEMGFRKWSFDVIYLDGFASVAE